MAVGEAGRSAESQQAAVPRAAAIYLAVVQFFLATTWVVYALYLPGLAEMVGIGRERIASVLLLDQLVFVATDFAMGVAADRVERLFGRLAPPIVAATTVSCLAFLLIPQVPALSQALGPLAPAVFLGLAVVWSASSSALRAPPWALLAKYAAAPSVPWLAALYLVGLSVASAVAPYLGLALRDVDPRLPFALSSLTLLATTVGLLRVERALRSSIASAGRPSPLPEPGRLGGTDGAPSGTTAPPSPPGKAARLLGAFAVATAILALGFQAQSSFNAAAQYLRFASPADLPLLLPIFWIGFSLFSLPASRLTARAGELAVMAWAAGLGTIGLLVAALAPNLALTIVAQLVAGGAWGCVLTAGLAAAVDLGRVGREGGVLGLWFSVQAVAAVLRLALVAGALDKAPPLAALLPWAPPALWLAGAVVLALAISRAGRGRSAWLALA